MSLKPATPEHLNQAQAIVLATYANGEFNHLADLQNKADFEEGVADCGDGLLRYLIVELAATEDCDSLGEAVTRVEAQIRDLGVVSSALRARLDEAVETPVWQPSAAPSPAMDASEVASTMSSEFMDVEVLPADVLGRNYSGPFAVALPSGQVLDGLSEEAATRYQRAHRLNHGRDPMKATPTLEGRSVAMLRRMWNELTDLAVDDDGHLLDPFPPSFERGDDRESVWHWFESQHPSISVGAWMANAAAVEDPYRFEYMLLGRLQRDCLYYLGHGGRAAKHLWALEERAQIQKMRELFDLLPVKPEWISLDDIANYEAQMLREQQGVPGGTGQGEQERVERPRG